MLQITNDFPPKLGGIENYSYSLAAPWKPDDIVVLTGTPPHARDFDRTVSFEIVRMRGVKLHPTPAVLGKAREIVKERGIDVIHFPAPLPLPTLGPQIRKSHGTPYVVSLHGGEFVLPAALPVGRTILRAGLHEASLLLCQSTFVQQKAREFFGDRPPSVYLPAGIDLDRFTTGLAPAFTSPSGGPVVLSVSRLIARKGPATLIRAWPRVLTRHPEAHLLIVGGGPDRKRLEKMAAELEVRDSVTFTGPVPWEKVPRLYASANIFALPTRERWGGLETEGLPLVYLEAAACGLPSVAGRAGGVEDGVVNGETGFVIDGASPKEASEAILSLLDDPELAKTMGEKARGKVMSEFTWPVIFERFQSLLQGIV